MKTRNFTRAEIHQMYTDTLLNYNIRREDLLDVLQAFEEHLPESEVTQLPAWDPDDTSRVAPEGWFLNRRITL